MDTKHVTRDEAFALLRDTSYMLNRKIRDVAADVAHIDDEPRPACSSHTRR